MTDVADAMARCTMRACDCPCHSEFDLWQQLTVMIEALDLLRPAHHTPYEDEEHQGSNCADLVMTLLARWHLSEGVIARVRDWCDRSEADEDWLGAVAEVRALLPEVAS